MRSILLVIALCFLPGAARSMTYSTSLDELVGVIDFLPSRGGREASFDFGQQFSDIQDVWIEIEAHVVAQETEVCGTLINPQPCVRGIQLLGFFARLDTEGHPVFSGQSSGGLSFGDFRDLEGAGVDISAFDDRFVQSEFDYLLDGQGSLTLFWSGVNFLLDRQTRIVIEPSGEILGARLIIEGTPIPEPSTALFLATGLLVLAGKKLSNQSYRGQLLEDC